MSEELKPIRCGCGGEANVYSWKEEDDGIQSIHYHAICMKCGIETNAYDTEAEAITAWNTAMNGLLPEGDPQKNVGVAITNSTEPERKKGKWQRRKDEDCWECSECHAVLENSDIGNHNYYYCYHCGADMMDICGYMDLEKANYE